MAGSCGKRSTQHEALDVAGLAGALVAIDDHGAQADVAGGCLEAHGHAVKELVDDEFFFYADHAVVGTGHADIGDVGRSFGENAFVGGGDVSVGADHGGDAAIEIPTHGNLFGSGFGVEIHENYFGVDLLQKLVGGAKGIVVRGHEDAALQVDHGVGNVSFLALIQTPAGHIGRIICGAQDPPLWTIAVAIDHLKIVENFSFVPNVIAGGDDVN